MIWENAVLMRKIKTGEDKLGNPIYSLESVKDIKIRAAPWTEEQIALEGREVTKNEKRYLTQIPRKNFPKCHAVKVEEHVLDITNLIDLSLRFTVIQVKVYKGDASGSDD